MQENNSHYWSELLTLFQKNETSLVYLHVHYVQCSIETMQNAICMVQYAVQLSQHFTHWDCLQLK